MAATLIGEVRGFACVALPGGWRLCDGGMLPIADHQPLFSLLGWRFGGDRWATFGIPALRGGVAGLRALTYGIALTGLYPTKDGMIVADNVGEIRLFAGEHAPAGWLPCDGRELPIASPWLELFEVIGRNWGGGAATFALPNLWKTSEAANSDSIARLSYIVATAGADASESMKAE